MSDAPAPVTVWSLDPAGYVSVGGVTCAPGGSIEVAPDVAADLCAGPLWTEDASKAAAWKAEWEAASAQRDPSLPPEEEPAPAVPSPAPASPPAARAAPPAPSPSPLAKAQADVAAAAKELAQAQGVPSPSPEPKENPS